MEPQRGKILLLAGDTANIRWRRPQFEPTQKLCVVSNPDRADTASRFFDAVVVADAAAAAVREFVRAARRNRRIGLLPLVVFTGDSRPCVPDVCCDRFLTGPFDVARLESTLASFEELTWRVHELKPLEESAHAALASSVHVLRYFVSRKISWLEPSRDPASPMGYSYGPIADMFNCRVGQERHHLKRLVNDGKLESRFADRIHLCPSCDVYQLNFRLTCASCGTANIHAHTAIHHYRCAFVGPKEQFQTLHGLACPKCHRGLRHIGVDYEEVARAYLCDACRMAVANPPVECLCLQCGRTFEPENAHVEVIESYALTAAGHEMARNAGVAKKRRLGGRLSEWPVFVREARLVRSVARECSRPYTLVHLKFAGFNEATQIEADRARAIVDQTITRLAESLRRTDLVGRLSDADYVLMFVEDPVQGAERVLRKANELAAELLREGLRLNIRTHNFSGRGRRESTRTPSKSAA
jgi:hypothetical protein